MVQEESYASLLASDRRLKPDPLEVARIGDSRRARPGGLLDQPKPLRATTENYLIVPLLV